MNDEWFPAFGFPDGETWQRAYGKGLNPGGYEGPVFFNSTNECFTWCSNKDYALACMAYKQYEDDYAWTCKAVLTMIWSFETAPYFGSSYLLWYRDYWMW